MYIRLEGVFMRLVSTSSLQPKMRLGKAILNDKNQILIQAGVSLTDRMINRLSTLKITYVYIEDEESKGIEPSYPITETTKNEAMKDITSAFGSLVEENVLSNSFIIDRLGKSFSQTVKSILTDVKNHNETISLLSDSIGHDRYTFYHSLNVAIYSIAMARELNYSEEEQITLGIGALLHDIGKTQIPKEILQKPSKLIDKEMELIKSHTELGFNILRKCHEISTVSAHCAYQHHERIDGTGYPRGIEGKEIHKFAKIISVADVFDAVCSNRVYAKAVLPHVGMELLFAGAGTQFDLDIIRAFRRTISIYPVGLTVILNDNRKAIVAEQNKNNSERPIVRVIEEDMKKVEQPYYVNLNKELTITITATETTLIGEQENLNNSLYFSR